MRDVHSVSQVAILLGAATLAADTTGPGVDLLKYDSAEVVLSVGAGGIVFDAGDRIDFILYHSDDDATWTTVTDADLLGITGTANGIIKTLNAAHAAATVSRFGYIGNKRYLQMKADFTGVHGTGTPMCANVFFDDALLAPTPNQV